MLGEISELEFDQFRRLGLIQVWAQLMSSWKFDLICVANKIAVADIIRQMQILSMIAQSS